MYLNICNNYQKKIYHVILLYYVKYNNKNLITVDLAVMAR